MCLLIDPGKAMNISHPLPLKGAKMIVLVPVTGKVGLPVVQEIFLNFSWLRILVK
jgi:hypothetical protein